MPVGANWDSSLITWDDQEVTWDATSVQATFPSLLPPSATAQERAMEQSTASTSAVTIPLRSLWDTEACPSNLLPWLAWAMSVDRWDPAWDEATKRQAIKDSVALHRRKGTVGAVLEGLTTYDLQVREWHQQVPAGVPFTLFLVPGPTLTEQDREEVLEIINRNKNARTHISFYAQADPSQFYGSGACVVGGVIAVTATT